MAETSPGRATSQRAALENRVTDDLLAALGRFLTAVEAEAVLALGSPVLVAAAGTSFAAMQPRPFTLGSVMRQWRKSLARVDSLPPDALLRMADSMPLPEQVFASTSTTLRSGRAQGLSRRSIAANVGRTLRIDAGPTTATAGTPAVEPVKGGQTWESVMRMRARTEATATYNRQQQDEIAASGGVLKKWVAHHDAFTRATHAAASGQVVPVVQPFIVGGQALMYPGDPAGSWRETANCRCVMVDSPPDTPEQLAAVADLTAYPVPQQGFAEIQAGVPEWDWKALKDQAKGDGTMNRYEYAAKSKMHAEIADFVGRWTGGFRHIERLRKQIPDGRWDSTIEAMAKGQKAPRLYRGMKAEKNPALAEMIAGIDVGDTIDTRHVASFTEDSVWGDRWVGSVRARTPSMLIVMEDARGLPVAAISNSPYEQEWLVTGKLRVVRIERESATKVTVHVRQELPDG